METPELAKEIVGTKQMMGGGIFSSNKNSETAEYDVLKWRWGSSRIIDMNTLKITHPTVEFLIKKDGMRAARWTKGFAVREYLWDEEKEDFILTNDKE